MNITYTFAKPYPSSPFTLKRRELAPPQHWQLSCSTQPRQFDGLDVSRRETMCGKRAVAMVVSCIATVVMLGTEWYAIAQDAQGGLSEHGSS